MMFRIFFIVLLLLGAHTNAKEYDLESSIINLKHGYQVGDLIIVEDQITSKVPFVVAPELRIAKTVGLRLVAQESHSTRHEGDYIFVNKVTYQIFHRSPGMKYSLPSHTYAIGNDVVVVPSNSYWFSRIASSELNKVLLNALGQNEPNIIKFNRIYFYLLLALTFSMLLILLYKKLDVSFFARMNGPFAKANKKIKSLHRANNQDSYDKAILILLDACNKSFGENMNASNVEDLLTMHSKYHPAKNVIKSFVTLTNSEIYSSRTFYSKDRFDDIYQLVKLLRVIERKV